MKIEIRKTHRCSSLVGMPVKNTRGEDLGTIEEVVIDLDQNKLVYAALSFGGFLGMGTKVFAIPWDALSLKFDERSSYFLLDVDPEKLKAAPGFGRDNWPDTTDPNWAREIDAYYRGRDEERKPSEPDVKLDVEPDEGRERFEIEERPRTLRPETTRPETTRPETAEEEPLGQPAGKTSEEFVEEDLAAVTAPSRDRETRRDAERAEPAVPAAG